MSKFILTFPLCVSCTLIIHIIRQYVYSDFDYLVYLTVAMCIDMFLAVFLNFSRHNLSFRLFSSKTTRKIFKYSVLLILGNLASHYTVNSEDVRYINWFHDFICTYLIVVEILSCIRTLNTLFPGFIPAWIVERLREYSANGKKYTSMLLLLFLLFSCRTPRNVVISSSNDTLTDTSFFTSLRFDSVSVVEKHSDYLLRSTQSDTIIRDNLVYIYTTDTLVKEHYLMRDNYTFASDSEQKSEKITSSQATMVIDAMKGNTRKTQIGKICKILFLIAFFVLALFFIAKMPCKKR